MKKYIRTTISESEVVDIEFDVYLMSLLDSLAATTIVELPDSRAEADPLAVENFDAFVECVEEIFDHYDFKYAKQPHRSEFSSYYYYAHQSQLDAKNVPKYVRVRISSHVEKHKSDKHIENIRDKINKELDEIKLPSTKKKQRYMPLRITADRKLNFDTYEDVLNYAEMRVRDLFNELNLNVPLSEYDEVGPF